MAEKTQRTSRSGASPHHLSPSPRSSNTATQLRGRPSSAPQSNPPTIQCPITPSRRPSTPPNKPSAPTPKSMTSTLGRMSTDSSGIQFFSTKMRSSWLIFWPMMDSIFVIFSSLKSWSIFLNKDTSILNSDKGKKFKRN